MTMPPPNSTCPLLHVPPLKTFQRRPLAGTRDELQARLDAFYGAHFLAGAFNERERNELSMPHLIRVQQEYVDAPVRIMFVGQETTNWVGTLGEYLDKPESLERVQRAYTRKAQQTKSTSALMRYRVELSRKHLEGNPAAVGWANLLRMDWDQGRGDRGAKGKARRNWAALGFDSPDSNFRELSAKTLAFELEVLQPDVIIFGSGHRYDACLKCVVGKCATDTSYVTDISNFLPRRVWPFEAFGAYCIRLPHPNMRPREKGGEGAPHFYDIGFQLLRDWLHSRTSGIEQSDLRR